MQIDLIGKKVLVIGVSCGLGCVIVLLLVCVGVDVVIMYEKLVDKVQVVVDEIKVLGWYGEVVQVDSVSVQVIQDVVIYVVWFFGGLDILVNNVGIVCGGLLEFMMLVDIDVFINVNICGVVIVIQEVLVYMVDGGCIINIGSCLVNCVVMLGIVVYVMIKFVFNVLICGLVCDLGFCGIIVNFVYSGLINSDMNLEDGEQVEVQCQMIVVGYYGQLEDIVVVVIFFVSLVVGQIFGMGLDVDGGLNV